MNDLDELREDVDERRLEVAIRELTGRSTPTDFTESILARFAREERAPQPRGLRWWWAAAVITMGVGATYAIARLAGDRPGPVSDAPAQERAIPPHRDATSMQAIEDLPRDTVHVRGHLLQDADLAALTRLPALRFLDLARCPALTDACVAHLARLSKLEHVVLDTLRLSGSGFARLTALPNLAHLGLSRTNIGAKGMTEIGKLRSLRHLDVSFCKRFGDSAMAQVLRLRGLRHLDLSGNTLIGEGMLLRLGELEHLRHLELAGIAGVTSAPRKLGGMDVVIRTGDAVGVDDRVLRVIAAKMPRLRFLNVSGCRHVTDAGIRRITALEHLHSLDLTGCPRISVAMLLRLAERERWRMFGMRVTETRVIAKLAKRAGRLTELRLSGTATRSHLDALRRLTSLKALRLEGLSPAARRAFRGFVPHTTMVRGGAFLVNFGKQ